VKPILPTWAVKFLGSSVPPALTLWRKSLCWHGVRKEEKVGVWIERATPLCTPDFMRVSCTASSTLHGLASSVEAAYLLLSFSYLFFSVWYRY